jgi:hypothetical protein
MKVELDVEEAWELMSCVVARMLDEAKVPGANRAKVRRWRSSEMRPGDETMRLLTRKINDDVASAIERKKRSQIRKPDWR